MRACSTANAIFIGLTLGVLAFAACSSGQTPAPPPPSPDQGAAESPSGAPGAASPSPSEAPSSAAAAPPPSGSPRSDITNEPGSGVVMNNAMTSGDAGASDRFQPMVDTIKANRDAFRRCFDLWGKTHPGANGSVYLVFHLKPDGKLDKAEADPSKGNLHAADVEKCMIDVAKTLTYPKSPSGKETKFTYPFDFKAK